MQTSSADFETTQATVWRLVRLRWILLAGFLVAILAVPAVLEIPLPTLPLLLVVALLAGFNALVAHRLRRQATQRQSLQGIQVAVDLVALGVLLFLTGGASNPLVSLLLLPVAAAALILPAPLAAASAAFAIALYSFLALKFVPLSIGDAGRATSLHLAGMWLTFVVSVILIAWMILRMTASLRARDAALAEAREQALRDERVVALGALAAGAAHELGTPLATMAVIAGELERDAGLTAAQREDLSLLRRQLAACKGIVTGLADRAGAARLEGVRAVAADRWLEGLVASWRALRPGASCYLRPAAAASTSEIVVDTTLEQALVNLLNNAANANPDGIEVLPSWSDGALAIEIRDRGNGFSAAQLADAGRQPLPSTTGGAGIGLLLAQSAISRIGGKLVLANRPEGGASARVELPAARTAAPREIS
ncbi:MAG: HAMP domain-containing histidine kinase [Rhodocyclales bacterium]|nr:HAMP domain-containing histidine kinase [Rhodocyclales bacterium]